ncbi:MAG TPA: fumarylacetoacetate hydrolase family protein [Actinomycetota bacterium]|nr:fumarylacetoacetate hydrolase family protein [Actinomycetota bacterium]
MRLVTYDHEGGRRLGALVDDVVVDLPSAVDHPGFPVTMEGLVGAGPATLQRARQALRPRGASQRFAVEDALLLVPLLPSSLRDFLAFEDHVKAGAARRGESVPEAWYEIPIYYKGNHRSVIGPDEEVPWPPFTEELDFELEVAAVLGGRGRDLDAGTAAQLVFGYTLMNDWSARDIQRKEMAARLGPAKSKDFATSFGPCIITADEFDPASVRLTARIDDDVWAEGSLADAYWTFPQMIAHVSQGEEVWPGDVYGSGTFGGGCGLDLGRFLWPGAVVELEAEGIGVLRNRVGPKPG